MEIEGLPLRPDLSYVEHPVKVLDEKERVTRNSVIKFYKVQWQNHSEDEATWEQESYIVKHYPTFSPARIVSCCAKNVFPCLFLTLGTQNLGSRFCFRAVDL